MRYLKIYEIHDEITRICKKYKLIYDQVTINPDGTIDVNGDVHVNDMDLTEIDVQFRKTENFYINSNHLTSLKGSPIECEAFTCHNNGLTSLKYSPRVVNRFIYCCHNQLSSLEDGPETVKDIYDFERF